MRAGRQWRWSRLGISTAVTLLAGSLLTRGLAAQGRRAADTARVVFVCEHGTVKSVVAAAHFNRLARAAGLRAVAISRGTTPDSALPSLVREGLVADGAGAWRDRPSPFRSDDLAGAALIVSFDQPVESVVAGRVPLRHWDGTPSVMRDYATGRDSIVARVSALVHELREVERRGPRAVKQP